MREADARLRLREDLFPLSVSEIPVPVVNWPGMNAGEMYSGIFTYCVIWVERFEGDGVFGPMLRGVQICY